MAKWTITFEDDEKDGSKGVVVKMKPEGETVVDEAFTPATCCALCLNFMWENMMFQEWVKANMDHVGATYIDRVQQNQMSSEKSDKG